MNSRQKGNLAEREVAKLLEAWWSQYEPCKFVRTPMSGGWSTAQLRRDFRASGDIMTTAAGFPFVVEVKRREGWSKRAFVSGRRSPVWGWWREAQVEANELNSEPMLWIRQNSPGRAVVWTILIRQAYAQGLSLPTPDLIWGASQFGTGVDIGAAVPVGYVGTSFLSIEPGIFARREIGNDSNS